MELKLKLIVIFMLSHACDAAVTYDKSHLNLTDIPRENITTDTEILNLNNNHIENTTADDFLGLTSLTVLNISSNHLSEFLNLTHVGSTLLSLDLSYNLITEVSKESLMVLTSLNSLKLVYNQITTVPDFSPLADLLGYLTIGFNNMTGWNVNSLSYFTKLKLLSAQATNLDVFPNLTASAAKLNWLSVGINNIAAVPEELFFSLTRLKTVYLHENQLERFPRSTSESIMVIRDLHLKHNKLTEFPSLLDFGPYLRYIVVSENDIAHINSEKFQLADRMTTEPLTIKMTHNKISTIPPFMGNNLQNGFVFDLSDNPNLVCDGNIAWVVLPQQGISSSVSGQCREPGSSEWRELSLLTYEDLFNMEGNSVPFYIAVSDI